MSKSCWLPVGAPVMKYINPDLLEVDYIPPAVEITYIHTNKPTVHTSEDIIPHSKENIKKPFGGATEDDDNDDIDDDEDAAMGLKNQPISKIFSIGSSGSSSHAPRKRGKDAKPVDQLDIKTGQLLRRYGSQTDAVDSMKVSAVYVSECCRGMRADTVGFKWRWAEDAPEHEKDWKPNDSRSVPINELLAIRMSEHNKSNFGVRYIKKEDGTLVDPRREKRLSRMKEGEEDISEGEYDDMDDIKPRGRARPVEQIDLSTGRVVRRYMSQMAAAVAMELNQYHISMACRGAKKEAGGFAWRSIEEDSNLDFDDPSYTPVAELLTKKGIFYENLQNVHKRIVEQVDMTTDIVLRRYTNMQEVLALLAISSRALMKCLTGDLKDAYGYIWRLYDGPEINLEEDNAIEGRLAIKDILFEIRKQKKRLSELRKDSAMLDDFEMDIEEIEEGDNMEDMRAESAAKHSRNPLTSAVEQIDLTTGDVITKYSNISAASAAVGGMDTFISNCASGVIDEAYGYGWRYVIEDVEEPPKKMIKVEKVADVEMVVAVTDVVGDEMFEEVAVYAAEEVEEAISQPGEQAEEFEAVDGAEGGNIYSEGADKEEQEEEFRDELEDIARADELLKAMDEVDGSIKGEFITDTAPYDNTVPESEELIVAAEVVNASEEELKSEEELDIDNFADALEEPPSF